MKKLLLLLTLILVVFIALNRQRIYLRDPLATVYRNDVKQEGAWVFINYSNDVLVQSGDITAVKQYLVQGWNSTPGTPTELKCLLAVACLAQEDHAPMISLSGATKAVMTNRQVSFTDAGTAVRITLR
ncbi:hypothetical protein [Granulicella arctica]|uniref:hypothetical protein n=1 Tax=Granulicella arctica TaxID=940613 RepID=UPI0021E09521|nr:hypothetical protein [Granulicella arctica]